MNHKTINLTPYHVEEKPSSEGFVLEFTCKTEGGKVVKVCLHLRFWWTTYIARALWKVIKYHEREVETAKANMVRPE